MVHVPVEDSDTPRRSRREHTRRRDGDRVVEAEALRAVALCVVEAGMVAWRPYERERALLLCASIQHCTRGVDHAAARRTCGGVAVRGEVDAARSVGLRQAAILGIGAHSRRESDHFIDVPSRVRCQKFCVAHARSRAHAAALDEAAANEVLVRTSDAVVLLHGLPPAPVLGRSRVVGRAPCDRRSRATGGNSIHRNVRFP
eukprot:7036072-Prymnesium_polylepis.1